MPVRKSHHDPKIGNINGWFPSEKMGHGIPFESFLEACCIMVFEFSLVIMKYEAQPFSTKYKHPSTKRHRKYTPDIEAMVLGQETPLVIEIKPEELLEIDVYMSIGQAIESDYNKKFMIITDKKIHQYYLVDNVFDLHYHARYGVKENVEEAYEDLLSDRVLTIGELAYQISRKSPEKTISSILKLMWMRKIGCEILSEKPFSSNTAIWLAKESEEIERDHNVFVQICETPTV